MKQSSQTQIQEYQMQGLRKNIAAIEQSSESTPQYNYQSLGCSSSIEGQQDIQFNSQKSDSQYLQLHQVPLWKSSLEAQAYFNNHQFANPSEMTAFIYQNALQQQLQYQQYIQYQQALIIQAQSQQFLQNSFQNQFQSQPSIENQPPFPQYPKSVQKNQLLKSKKKKVNESKRNKEAGNCKIREKIQESSNLSSQDMKNQKDFNLTDKNEIDNQILSIAQSDSWQQEMKSLKDQSKNTKDKMQKRKSRLNWTQEEDRKLIQIFQHIGQEWKQLKKFFPQRTARQCKDRYLNTLNPNLNRQK